MSVEGIRPGFTPTPTRQPLATDPSQVGKSGGGVAVNETTLPQPSQQLAKLMGASTNPASALKQGEDVDPKTAGNVSSSLGALGGDQVNADIYAFMALFQKLAQSMRDTARTQRTTEMQAQVSALQNAAEKMKDAAALRFAGAVVQGAFQIAGGVTQMGFSASAINNSMKGAQLESKAANMSPKAVEVTGIKQDIAQFNAKGQSHVGMGTGASSSITGAGGIISAGLTYAADLKDADKAKLETEAKVHETAVQHANDMMQQMMDVIRDVRDKLQSIQQAAIETNKGIARNI